MKPIIKPKVSAHRAPQLRNRAQELLSHIRSSLSLALEVSPDNRDAADYLKRYGLVSLVIEREGKSRRVWCRPVLSRCVDRRWSLG